MTSITATNSKLDTDWYLMADLSPEGPTLKLRQAAITEVARHIKSQDYRTIALLLEFSILPSNAHHSSLQSILAIIKKHDQSVSDDEVENNMVIRSCLIEAFSRIATINDGDGQEIATLLISAVPLLPKMAQRWVASRLQLLIHHSTKQLEQWGLKARTDGSDQQGEGDEKPKELSPLAEEIDVLWWSYNKFSPTNAKSYLTLSPEKACCTMATELAHTVWLPPIESQRSLLLREVQNLANHKVTVTELDASDVLSAIDQDARNLVLNTAVLFPTLRALIQPGQSPHIEQQKLTLSEWAVQLFNEVIALRVIFEAEE